MCFEWNRLEKIKIFFFYFYKWHKRRSANITLHYATKILNEVKSVKLNNSHITYLPTHIRRKNRFESERKWCSSFFGGNKRSVRYVTGATIKSVSLRHHFLSETHPSEHLTVLVNNSSRFDWANNDTPQINDKGPTIYIIGHIGLLCFVTGTISSARIMCIIKRCVNFNVLNKSWDWN